MKPSHYRVLNMVHSHLESLSLVDPGTSPKHAHLHGLTMIQCINTEIMQNKLLYETIIPVLGGLKFFHNILYARSKDNLTTNVYLKKKKFSYHKNEIPF